MPARSRRPSAPARAGLESRPSRCSRIEIYLHMGRNRSFGGGLTVGTITGTMPCRDGAFAPRVFISREEPVESDHSGGYKKLKAEIEHLSTTKRREVADRITIAREFGDIAENPSTTTPRTSRPCSSTASRCSRSGSVRARDHQEGKSREGRRLGRVAREAARCFRQGRGRRVPHRRRLEANPTRTSCRTSRRSARRSSARRRAGTSGRHEAAQVQDPGNQGVAAADSRSRARPFQGRGPLPARADVVVVGAGILGLATAVELGRRLPERRVIVVEKEPAIALHQTGRNSCVVHSGVYYPPGSLKAQLCTAGRLRLREYREERRSRTTSAES